MAVEAKFRKGDQFITLIGSIVGNPERGYKTEYYWPGLKVWDTYGTARREGFRYRLSDDFNIGLIRGGKFVAMLWMREVIDIDPDVLHKIAESAGLPLRMRGE